MIARHCGIIFWFNILLHQAKTQLEYTPQVETSYGSLRGKIELFEGTRIYQFFGVPYAKPPVGSLRFMMPAEPEPWDGVRDAVEHGPPCIQLNAPKLLTEPGLDKKSREDCLYLDITVKEETFQQSAKRLVPVMLWIHGGSFKFGSGGEEYYSGIPLVPYEDVILVSINYRLGIFGFLFPGEIIPQIKGNMGLWDQNLALQWVRNNIKSFGGDPNSITLFGTSSGAISVSSHVLSPISRQIFNRAILQSGSLLMVSSDLPDEKTRQNMKKFLDEVGCSNGSINCLQELSVDKIYESSMAHSKVGPVFGDRFLPESTEKLLEKPDQSRIQLMIGGVKDEASIFLIGSKYFNPFEPTNMSSEEGLQYLKHRFKSSGVSQKLADQYFDGSSNSTPSEARKIVIRAISDASFLCPTYIFGHFFANIPEQSSQVYGYYLTQKPKRSSFPACRRFSWLGVCHSDDIPFTFGLPIRNPKDYSDQDVKLSRTILNIWASFARDGKPPKQESIDWPAFHEEGASDLPAMELNVIRQIERNRPNFCLQHWDEMKNFKLL